MDDGDFTMEPQPQPAKDNKAGDDGDKTPRYQSMTTNGNQMELRFIADNANPLIWHTSRTQAWALGNDNNKYLVSLPLRNGLPLCPESELCVEEFDVPVNAPYRVKQVLDAIKTGTVDDHIAEPCHQAEAYAWLRKMGHDDLTRAMRDAACYMPRKEPQNSERMLVQEEEIDLEPFRSET